jgi:alkaline phosphatase
MKRISSLLFALLITTAALAATPKNIILFVGDGMGPAHFTAAKNYRGADFNIGKIKTIGLFTTFCADRNVTDSAAAASAFATGEKTKYEALSVDEKGAPRLTVLEAAKGLGKATGLVTTAEFYDATPAAFAVHVDYRRKYADVTNQMLRSGVDVIAGTGSQIFGKTPLPPLADLAKQYGYTLITDPKAIDTAPRSHALLAFESQDDDLDTPGAPLPQLARWALDRVSTNPNGFFLLVEEEGTDGSSHNNNVKDLTKALKSFDEAVGVGLDYASKHPDTLILVLGDHETGGMRIDETGAHKFRIEWSSVEHTATAIPVFSYGPGSERFTGFFDNTDIGRTLLSFEGAAPAIPGTSSAHASDVTAVVDTLVTELGVANPTFIAGKELTGTQRAAFASARTIDDQTEANRLLPAGVVRVDRFDVQGDKANVMIWTGPIPGPPPPGVMQLACGHGRGFTLQRQADGRWTIVSRSVAQC